MATTVKAVVIEEDGTVEVRQVKTDLESMNALVGGYLEAVTGNGPWHAYVDEEGKYKNLPVNYVANLVLTRLGWPGISLGDFVVGRVVILGDDGPDEADVPEDVAAVALNAHRHV